MKTALALGLVISLAAGSMAFAENENGNNGKHKGRRGQAATQQAAVSQKKARNFSAAKRFDRVNRANTNVSQRSLRRFNRNNNVNAAKLNNATNAKIRNANKFQRRNNVVVNNRANHRTNIMRSFNYGNNRSYLAARRGFNRERHERRWWNNHYNRIVFYGGGYYYWNAGWWYPAYGYAPYSSFVYEGPIYGYNNYAPGDITVQVQQALAQQGYYYGAIDGIIGPQTRGAIERFQERNGLAVTATIDGETLASLGLA